MTTSQIIIIIIMIIFIIVFSIINYYNEKITYLKLQVNNLKIKSEAYLYDFNNLVININNFEPYNKNIKNFNNAYIDIVNKYNILKTISTDIKKANNLSNIITLTYTDYYNEMYTVNEIHNDFNTIKNYNVENTINLIKTEIYDFKIINNKSKYKINFELNIINQYFSDALIINSKIIDILDIKNIVVLRQYYKQLVDLLNKSRFELIRQKKLLMSYHNAETFIYKNVKSLTGYIDNAYSASCDIYVPSYIKIKKYDIIKKAKLYIPDYSKKNVKSSKNNLQKIIDDLTYYVYECNRYAWSNRMKKKKKK